jgi:2-phosphosulfolactate phosphatase
MTTHVEVWLSPADYTALFQPAGRDTSCVVFDILRATSVMSVGLARRAAGFVPVTTIAEALAARGRHPGALLGGERDGLRITAALSGGVDFDFGNSPREYTADRVAGRTVISTTTNGTRALSACRTAAGVAVGSFLNLAAVGRWLIAQDTPRLLLVCAGTGDAAAWEDVLAAGATVELLRAARPDFELRDSARVALSAWTAAKGDLSTAVGQSQNGRRLLANPALRADVECCLERDTLDLIGVLDREGVVRAVTAGAG